MIPFVGERMTRSQFQAYLSRLSFQSFRPEFVTLHHTASPSLAQRPNGFSAQHLKNLRHYYEVTMGWSGAPHVFIDDVDDGIIVFQRLDRRGVHAASFNDRSWGLEMLGYFDTEPFHTGRGAKVRDNTVAAIALMNQRLNAKPESLRFHRDDPKTAKSCPGRLVTKADMVGRIASAMDRKAPADQSDIQTPWVVRVPGGSQFAPVHSKDGRPIVPVRRFLDFVRSGGQFQLLDGGDVVAWSHPSGRKATIEVAEIDEDGSSWSLARDLAEAAGYRISVEGHVVFLR